MTAQKDDELHLMPPRTRATDADPADTRPGSNTTHNETTNMKTTSIDTINNDLADGAVIQAFAGVLTKLYEMKTIGAGTEREWTKQNGELTAPDGKKISVEFRRSGVEVPQSWKGKSLLFQSVKLDRGSSGIKILDDTYNGKTTRKLCITGTAEMSFFDDAGHEAPSEQRRHKDGPPEQAGRDFESAKQPAGRAAQSGNPMRDLRMKIARRATVWQICYDTAVASALCVADRHKFAMVPAAVGALASSLYIDTMRGLNLDDVDINAIDWKAAKGRTMANLINYLNEQVAHTRETQAGAATGGEIGDAKPQAQKPGPLWEQEDEIPF